MDDLSPRLRHERIHRDAAAKVWDDGHWRVAPLTQEHMDHCVVEFERRKFKDWIWVSIDALDAGYVPNCEFSDNTFWHHKREPSDG